MRAILRRFWRETAPGLPLAVRTALLLGASPPGFPAAPRPELPSLADHPWDAPALRHLASLSRQADRPAPPPEPLLCCLAGGRAAAMAASLEFAAALPPSCRVLLLDDSADGPNQADMAALLAAWRDRLGERLHVETPATPLGPAIGGNWLLAHPWVREAAFVLWPEPGLVPPAPFPNDCLGLLARAALLHPEAAGWGCGARFLDPAAPDQRDLARLDAPAFALTPARDATGDAAGRLPSILPCPHLAGGVRLFSAARLLADGGWNLAFPDAGSALERDLRLTLAGDGLPWVSQGFLDAHWLLADSPPAPSADARVAGYKLAHRFPPEALAGLHAQQADALTEALLLDIDLLTS